MRRIIYVLMIVTGLLPGQLDTNDILSYFPLQVGNIWEYHVEGSDGFEPFYYSRITVEVMADTLFQDNRTYYIFEETLHYEDEDWGEPVINTYYLSVDTTNKVIFSHDSCIYYNLGLELGDTMILTACGTWNHTLSAVGIDTLDLLESYIADYFVYDINTSDNSRTFYDGIGMGYEYHHDSTFYVGWGIVHSYSEKAITGAIINSVQYGELFSEQENYFPLEIGKSWTYESQGNTLTETIVNSESIGGNLYFEFDQFREFTNHKRFRWNDNKIIAFIEEAPNFSTTNFYDFSADLGESWDVIEDIGDCLWTSTMSMVSKTDSVFTNIGIFYPCFHFHHFIAFDYEFDEWFAPDVGLVQRDVITIAGLQRWILTDTTTVSFINNSMIIPETYFLHQNYPNPFNPITTIQYELPQRSDVQITIYDLLGRKVTTLISQTQDAGFKSVIWDASNSKGQPVSAGV